MRLGTLFTLLAPLLLLVPGAALASSSPGPSPLVVSISLPAGAGPEAIVAQALEPSPSSLYRTAPLRSLEFDPEDIAQPELATESGELEQLAEERALDFDLVGAAKALREAADKLRRSAWVLVDPQKTSLVHVKAASASADADEDDLALRYFRLALSIHSDGAGGHTLSPKAEDYLARARKEGPLQFGLPNNATLEQIRTGLGADGIVVVTASSERRAVTVTEHLHFSSSSAVEPETHHRLPEEAAEQSEWLASEKQRLEGLIASKFQSADEQKRPWFKRWWIYAAVGGAVAAGVISAFAISNSLDTPLVDITVHH